MPPLDYILLRLIRRHLPAWMMERLLRDGRVVQWGPETSAPIAAANRFGALLELFGLSVADKRILLFGFGGFYGVAVELLSRGAGHLVLLDPYASLQDDTNLDLARRDARFLCIEGPVVSVKPEWITVVRESAESYAAAAVDSVDLVLSNSVFEHVDEVRGSVAALARITSPGGHHVHLVDLRDHYFRYPFEMLCYRDRVWRRWLNPPSNLNRWRIPDYLATFRQHFGHVDWEVTSFDREAFRLARGRIRPEFLTGDENLDAATRIVIHASEPSAPEG